MGLASIHLKPANGQHGGRFHNSWSLFVYKCKGVSQWQTNRHEGMAGPRGNATWVPQNPLSQEQPIKGSCFILRGFPWGVFPRRWPPIRRAVVPHVLSMPWHMAMPEAHSLQPHRCTFPSMFTNKMNGSVTFVRMRALHGCCLAHGCTDRHHFPDTGPSLPLILFFSLLKNCPCVVCV